MTTLGANSREMLRNYLERIERVETDIAERKADLKEIYKEAKDEGFDVSIMRAVAKIRAKGLKGELRKRDEAQSLLDTYLAALGWLPGGDTDVNVDVTFANDATEPV